MNNTLGKLYLIPTTLGETEPLEVLPYSVKKTIEDINIFIVENEKTARKFIKQIASKKPQASLKILPLGKYVDEIEISNYLNDCLLGQSVGLLSEAGVPAIADPGADIVKLAHEKEINVVPLVGPSSILLAMMASGFNGQNFAFNGYLPIKSFERKTAIKRLEKISKEKQQSQLFIETPYRNTGMFKELVKTLNASTLLCVACNLTLPTQYIKTYSIKTWKLKEVDIHKKPTIFIIQA